MNAWFKRNEQAPGENELDDPGRSSLTPGHPSVSSESPPNPGPSRHPVAESAPRFDTRLKTVATLLYVVGALVVLLVVHGRPFQLQAANVSALDRVVFAGGVLVWSMWLFPWHRFGRNVLVVPVSAGLALVTLAVYFSGGWNSPFSVFYLCVVVFCAGYFSAEIAALCVAVTLLASLSPQLYAPDAARLTEYLVFQIPVYLSLAFACRYAVRERTILQQKRDSEKIRELERRLWHEASLDPLTGLYNRGRFEMRLNEEIERAGRTGERFMLLFVDVDDFKKVNDNHGHRMGDETLKLVARVLRSCSRRIDMVARYGGDEFMVMLPGASLPEAHRFFERIRRQVAESSGRTLGPELRLSAGAVQGPDYSTDPAALLEAADEAMYRAKHRGKNRMFAALSLAPTGRRRYSGPEE